MLKRLGTLIGFVFFCIIAAIAMPIVFLVIGGIILTLTLVQRRVVERRVYY